MKFQRVEGKELKRYEIPMWEGVNALVNGSLMKRGELAFAENARSRSIGLLSKREGHALFGNNISATANYGLYDCVTDTHTLFRIAKVSGVISVYRYSEQMGVWVQLTGNGTSLSAAECDFTAALERCFIVNGVDENRYVESNKSTVTTASNSSGLLYASPRARLINYYKDRIYLGDYYRSNGSRDRTGICWSSPPIGIVGTVQGDHTAPITTLNVTETKYIKPGSANDSLDIYRGNTFIGTVTVTAKTENTLTVTSFGTNLLSSDELWVAGTHNGDKTVRWNVDGTGINVKSYDNIKNPCEEDLTLMTNVGNNMMVFTNNNISLFNGEAIRPLDLNIGCVSKKSFVRLSGQGIFVHYSGIYSTTGGMPRLVSAKIQPLFDNADRTHLENSCAATDGFSYLVHIGQVTFREEDNTVKKVLNNVVIEWNLRQNNFYVHTDIPMSHFTTFVSNRTSLLVFTKNATPTVTVTDGLYITDVPTVVIS